MIDIPQNHRVLYRNENDDIAVTSPDENSIDVFIHDRVFHLASSGGSNIFYQSLLQADNDKIKLVVDFLSTNLEKMVSNEIWGKVDTLSGRLFLKETSPGLNWQGSTKMDINPLIEELKK